ncbi:MAG: hypothetical protein JW946_00080 [Candidatus Omnitrophica bacterium]|nr:hypothetical protein [Candidatus Omnitrophota bacterium]
MKKAFLWILVFLAEVNFCFAQEPVWQKKDAGVDEKAVVSLLATGCLLAATDNAVYVSSDSAASWQRMLFLNESSAKINDFAAADSDNLLLYLATTNGLYKIEPALNEATRILKGWGDKKYITCVKTCVAASQKIYAGTKAGLFVNNSAGRWEEISYFKNKAIIDIVFFNDYAYVVTDDGIYRKGVSEDNWKRIFVVKKSKEGFASEQQEEAVQEEENNNTVKCLESDRANNILCAGCSNGIFISGDCGDSWNKMPDSGLIDNCIEDVLLLSNKIIAATEHGVFLFDKKLNDKWQMLSTLSYRVNKLVFDGKTNCLYAATLEGIYEYSLKEEKSVLKDCGNKYAVLIKKQLTDEPDIRKIQEAAVEYAEVNPDKIKNMREAAKNSAWMPKVSVGLDYDADNNIDLDRGGTNNPDVFIVGPEDRSWGYSMSLSWDLGELLWNPDQTSIDVRSRLMVQLRDDILTEVTGLYFERKRLQSDIMNGKPGDAALEMQILRLEELTARIDALTGGYLSAHGGKNG